MDEPVVTMRPFTDDLGNHGGQSLDVISCEHCDLLAVPSRLEASPSADEQPVPKQIPAHIDLIESAVFRPLPVKDLPHAIVNIAMHGVGRCYVNVCLTYTINISNGQ